MIGDRIKALRAQKKVTQEALAKYLFISPQAVSRWEQGLAVPDTALLIPLADYFSVSVDYLLRDASEFASADYASAFEITQEFNSRFIRLHFKNISSYSFQLVRYKILYHDQHGEIVDYRTSYFCDSDPGTTKIERRFNLDICKPTHATVKITECALK